MNLGEEPYNFSPQSGAYEVTMSDDPNHGKVMTQVVLRPPIDTCWTKMGVPPNLIGDFFWYAFSFCFFSFFFGRRYKHKLLLFKLSCQLFFRRNFNNPDFKLEQTFQLLKTWKLLIALGLFSRSNVNAKIDAFVDKKDEHAAKGVFLASNVNHGGCDLVIREGVYFWVNISKGMSELCLNHSQFDCLRSRARQNTHLILI